LFRLRRKIPGQRPVPKADETCEIGRAHFGFVGFAEPATPTLLSRFDYRPSGPPPMRRLEQVLFLPGQRCLYSASGERLEISRPTYIEPDAPEWFNAAKVARIERVSMPPAIVPPNARRIDEPVLFLGEVHDHWGHFITDTLARFWALEHAPPGVKLLFAPDPGDRMQAPVVRTLLEALGLGPERILRPEQPVLISELHCPIPALQFSRIYQEFETTHRHIAERLAATSRARPPRRPVYLTRSRLGGGMRRLGGEEELEDRLKREGYEIVSPERLGLAEQMAIFNGDRPVVGAFGSAMHTVLFRRAEQGQRLAILFPEKIPPRFMMVEIVKASQASYVKCIRSEAPDGSRWSLDPKTAMQRLDAAGLLGRR
jgi:hypothetical protein